jgi:predicted MFS family arabinose efflux permease
MRIEDRLVHPVHAVCTPHPGAALSIAGPRQTLAILLLVFAINFMDRQIIALLVEPIRNDLGLSDTQIGVLYGFAFAVLFVTAGIPIARVADRGNRARIINWSLVVFSLMTVVCGLATNYWQLMAARAGVAIGEGGTNPPSHSIISDLYPVNRRSMAMAVFSLGPNVGILLGFLVGGWTAQVWGWRAALVIAGLIGLLFSVVSFRFLKEPRRHPADGVDVGDPPSARAVLRALGGNSSIRHLFAGTAVFSVAAYALVGWLPSFLIRGHGLSTATVGTLLALVLGLGGGVGTMIGGVIADRLGERRPAWRLRIVAVAFTLMAPLWAAVFLVTDTAIMLALLVLPGALLGFYLGPTFAMVQSLAHPSMRATAAALLLFVLNVVGLGIGPLAVGVLSDALLADFGPKSLGIALLLVPPFCVWAAYHYYAAARTIGADLARVGTDGSGFRRNEA